MTRFNPLIESLSTPPIPMVQAWAKAYDGSRGPLIDLSQAVPGYPAHPDMLRLLGEAASSKSNAGYGAIEGDDSLRKALSNHMSSVYQAPLSADNIHITSGCNQAFLCASMAVAGAGDTILVTNPFYFNHETTLSMMGIRTGQVACAAENGFLPRIEDISHAITPDVRAFAIVSPNNPTGAIYPVNLLRAIFELCRARGIWLILDETYRDFLPEAGHPAHNLFSMEGWEETLIDLYSFSKSFCIPGHRLGAITAGPLVVEQIAKIMDNVQICPPRAAQNAVALALPLLADWREENRQVITRRAETLKQVLAHRNDWKLAAIGAYFAFVQHPYPTISSVAVAARLAKEAGILCLPGHFFGQGQDGFLRFAFANATSQVLTTLSERLAL